MLLDNKVLLIGPCSNKKDPSKTGGIIILFEDLLSQCQKRNIGFLLIDTNKANYPNIFLALLSIYLKIFLLSFRASHISLHGTANDYVYIAPFVVLWSKLLRKKSSLRKFAGNFTEIYESSSNPKKKFIEFALKNSNYNFFETKYLVNYFSAMNRNTYWFPNVRRKAAKIREDAYQKKFIFIGNVTKEKGINELLEASNLLDDSFVIDIYGNIAKDLQDCDFTIYKAKYKGALRSDNVLDTLCQYDVLILPSYREGYPGVIIEALSVGLPIIATNLQGISEMVDEKSSILIEPRNVEQLKEAIESIDEHNYKLYSLNALKAFEQFDSDVQTNKFLEATNA